MKDIEINNFVGENEESPMDKVSVDNDFSWFSSNYEDPRASDYFEFPETSNNGSLESTLSEDSENEVEGAYDDELESEYWDNYSDENYNTRKMKKDYVPEWDSFENKRYRWKVLWNTKESLEDVLGAHDASDDTYYDLAA